MDSDLGDVVDFSFNPLDISPDIIPSHPQVCPNLAKTETNCNYIADGANLCAQHSTHWQQFTTCMFQQALQGDSKNPLAVEATFDAQLSVCAKEMPDYSVDDLRNCTYGDEADQLHAMNKDATARIFAELGMSAPGLVWASVGGKLVSDSSTESFNSRATWQRKLVSAVCQAYTGPKPTSCSSSFLA